MADKKAINAIKAHASCDHERALLRVHACALKKCVESKCSKLRTPQPHRKCIYTSLHICMVVATNFFLIKFSNSKDDHTLVY